MLALNRENLFHFIKEAIWLTITGIAAYAILYPIDQIIDFKYYWINVLFIFITITYFRWTVSFRNLPFLHPPVVRFVFFAVNLSLFIYLMKQEQEFLMYIDNFDTTDLGFPKVIMYDHVKEELYKYLYKDVVLFGTGSLVMIIMFNLRLMVSWWQLYNQRAGSLMQ